MYDNILDNQHSSMRKFTRRWFDPHVVTSAKDNATYHFVELDRTRLVIPIMGKRVKLFKKRHNDEPKLDDLEEEDNEDEQSTSLRVNEEEEMDD